MAAASAHAAMRGWGAGWVVVHQVVAQVAVAGVRRRRSIMRGALWCVVWGARAVVSGGGSVVVCGPGGVGVRVFPPVFASLVCPVFVSLVCSFMGRRLVVFFR